MTRMSERLYLASFGRIDVKQDRALSSKGCGETMEF